MSDKKWASDWAREVLTDALYEMRLPYEDDEAAALVIETALAAKLAEREAEVVAWLNDRYLLQECNSAEEAECFQIKMAIERGEHRTKDNT